MKTCKQRKKFISAIIILAISLSPITGVKARADEKKAQDTSDKYEVSETAVVNNGWSEKVMKNLVLCFDNLNF